MENMLSIAHNSKISFFNTTIYDLSSLFLAFSNGIMHFSPIALLINEQLEEFAKLSNSSAVLLMSEDLLVIGNYSMSDYYIELCELVGLRFLNVMDSFKLHSVRLDNVIADIDYDTELIVSNENETPHKRGQKSKNRYDFI